MPFRLTDSTIDAALALLYPQPCAVCNVRPVESRRASPACAECWRKTRVFTGGEWICWKCGALSDGAENLLTQIDDERRGEARCHACDDLSFTAARAVGVYAGALRAAAIALKRTPHVGSRIIELLNNVRLRPPLDAATRILPVPLHPLRERERGFNQAAILARALAKKARLPFDEHSLVRAERTARHRAGMDKRARRETVERAFAVARPRLVEGEKILLIDDVFTTGATVSACADVLLKSGAAQVFALTLARA